MAATFLSLILLFTSQLPLAFSGESNSMESVPDLQNSMYKVVDGYPCVRLLNLSGVIGCSNPGREKVVAPIVRFKNADALSESSAILVSMEDFSNLFTRISNDVSFASNVGGVIVEYSNELQNKSKGFSPDKKFPQVEFAPYKSVGYEWNPIGSDIMWRSYNFPVFLLSESSTGTLQEAALKNEQRKKAFIANVAEFDLVMQTTKAGTHDSESCLKEETCLPLGGYSVWSSLPPINTSSLDQSKPIIMIVASMDSLSFFRDKSLGADSPISGLIALLAAVDALSNVDGLSDLGKQLVFAVFTGEAWGYIGSRRFLVELDMHSDAVNGLNKSSIEMVIEIGSVGRGFSQGVKHFFAHMAGISSSTNETLNALKRAQDSMQSENITIKSATTTNPGIPPSSLMAFMKKNALISGIVLEDFDAVFANKFYHSHLDDLKNVNMSSIVAAASLVARTTYILGSGEADLSSSAISAIKVNVSLVEELMGCLLDCETGLSCELVKSYISPTSTCPSHYVGVILEAPTAKPYLGYINDVPRFIWNYLADKTSIPGENGSPVCQQDCVNENEVCIKAERGGKGVCVVSTTRYVPAYSTRLEFKSGVWSILPPNSSDSMGAVDPVWTESNWNTIGVRVYSVQDAAYDRLILLGGIAITILAYLAIVITRALITKAIKRD